MNGSRHLIIAGLTALALTAEATGQAPTAPATADTTPAAVVQRFVDAANLRDAKAMAALVAPDVIFEQFPGGQVIARGREAIEAMYARGLSGVPSTFHIRVEPRIVEGNLVVDQEHIAGVPAGDRQATWMYQVQGGLIHRAWVLDGRPGAVP